MRYVLEKLKKRWGIRNSVSVLLILASFAMAGTSTLYTSQWVHQLLGLTSNSPLWIRILVFAIVVLPLYYAFLYAWGVLLGQRQFVTEFIRIKLRFLQGQLFRKHS